MTFELYCFTYNDEWLLPQMVSWYREKLKGHELSINLIDNESADSTPTIGKELGCNIIHNPTGGKLVDSIGIKHADNIWKQSTADYIIMICTDEFIDIEPEKLQNCTICRCIGYNMISDGTQELMDIDHGVRFEAQDKCCIFSPIQIKEMNYSPGFHYYRPEGNVKWNDYIPIMYHMSMISEEWMVERHRRGRERLSDENKKNGWGNHLGNSDQEIRDLYYHAWDLKQKIK